MRFRKLRIAWSVTWGIACVLLIVLWVRSYYVADSYGFNRQAGIGLCQGDLAFCTILGPGLSFRVGYNTHALPVAGNTVSNEWTFGKKTWNAVAVYGSVLRSAVSYIVVKMPALVAASSLMAVAPWIKWSRRFSLRTLLIATTLFAVVLGLIVYATR
jgi:hypothetical protein